MPMYDYYCSTCMVEYEIFVKDRDITVPCLKCGVELKRMLSAPSFYIR